MQSLQAEQKDAKAAEKKLREYDSWISSVEEAQSEVDNALEVRSHDPIPVPTPTSNPILILL